MFQLTQPHYKFNNRTELRTSHFRSLLRGSDLSRKIKLASAFLSDLDFDSIAFRGMSGALIAPAVAANLNKNIILVRKNETRYSTLEVEGPIGPQKYIIIDDFVHTGATVKAILEAIKKFEPLAKCQGLYLHSGQDNVSCIEEICPLLNQSQRLEQM